MFLQFQFIKRLLRAWPGKKYLGEYRLLPLFFVTGAAVEYLMIHWYVGEVNFYRTFKKRKVEELVVQREKQWLLQTGVIQIKTHH